MKKKRPLLISAFFLAVSSCLIFISSCKESGTKDVTATNDKKSNQLNANNQLPKQERLKQRAEENRNDSIVQIKLLHQALSVSMKHIHSDHFKNEYEITPDDRSQNVVVSLTIGYLFSSKKRHLLIRRSNSWATYHNLYLIDGNDLKSVLAREEWDMTYINDTARDVNGDGFKDFLIHSYPSSGCCRRDVYNVYLSQENGDAFTNDYRFINPTFSPNEGIIRGVLYGHPGEVGLYKYKWNGLQVDTLEFIYPDQSDTVNRHFFKTRSQLHSSKSIKRTTLKLVPKDYYGIESYDWFKSY